MHMFDPPMSFSFFNDISWLIFEKQDQICFSNVSEMISLKKEKAIWNFQ
jgi:hypothetical protein